MSSDKFELDLARIRPTLVNYIHYSDIPKEWVAKELESAIRKLVTQGAKLVVEADGAWYLSFLPNQR